MAYGRADAAAEANGVGAEAAAGAGRWFTEASCRGAGGGCRAGLGAVAGALKAPSTAKLATDGVVVS